MSREKTICLLFFGDYCPQDKMSVWLDNIPELKVLNKIEPVFVFGKNTAEVVAGDWLNLAQTIFDLAAKYDGFVILHNLENLLFSSAAISFLLPSMSKPIVFTGGLNVKTKDSGIKSNIINACQLASHSLAEVCLLFGNKILRANQASRNFSSSLNLFQAPPSGLLGQIDFSIRIFNQDKKEITAEMNPVGGLEEDILIVEAGPILSAVSIKNATKNKKAVFVKADINQVSSLIIKELEEISKKIPVIIFGKQQLDQFSDKIIIISNMTLEASIVKLMWSLKQSTASIKVKSLMNKNLAGEIII